MHPNQQAWSARKPWLTKNRMIVLGFLVGILIQIVIVELMSR